MRAVQVSQYGGPEVLRTVEIARPDPISTEVLVRVVAAGVNPVDCKTRRGEGVAKWVGQPPFVLGWDVAGVVEAMGYGVTRFAVGDLVFGMPRFPRAAGAYAEYVTGPSRQFARVPARLSATEAAALPLAGLTAWQCLVDTAGVGQGQAVVVHGATGGVGRLAVRVATSLGASVIASSRASRGALQARDADVALDLVGGADTIGLLGTLRSGGILLAVADGADDEVKRAAARMGVKVSEPLVEPDGCGLEKISRLVEAGQLKVDVAATFPLERADEAHRRLEAGGVSGKIVLEVSEQ